MAEQNLKKAYYLRKKLTPYLVFSGPIFNEMVIHVDDPVRVNQELYKEGIIGGLLLDRYIPSRENQMLICVTEQNTREQMDRLVHHIERSQVTA